MVSLTPLTLSAPSSARSTPAPYLRLPSLSEVAGPELLSLDLVKYSEWLNVLPFYNNGSDSLPEPVYDIGLDGLDIWQLAQNKINRGRGVQAVGLQRSFSLPTAKTVNQQPLARSCSLPDAVSPPVFQKHKVGSKISVNERLSRTSTPKPLFSTSNITQPPAKQHLKLPSVSQVIQHGRTSTKTHQYGIPPNPLPLPPLRCQQPSSSAPQQPVFEISQHLPSSNTMFLMYDDIVYQPLGPVYRPASRANEQPKIAKNNISSSQSTSYSLLHAAQEHVRHAQNAWQPQASEYLLSSPRKKSSAILPVPVKVPSRVTGYDTEAARSERHRSKSTSPVVSKSVQQQQPMRIARPKSRDYPATNKAPDRDIPKLGRITPLKLKAHDSGFVDSTSAFPCLKPAQAPLDLSAAQTASPIPVISQHLQPPPVTIIDSLYAVPGSILLSMDYRVAYIGRDCTTWLHLSNEQNEALPTYSILVLCVQSDIKALQNFLKLARREIQYHERVRAAAFAAGKPFNSPMDGRTMSQTFNLRRGDGIIEPFVLTISLSLRILSDRSSPVFSGTLIPLWLSMNCS